MRQGGSSRPQRLQRRRLFHQSIVQRECKEAGSRGEDGAKQRGVKRKRRENWMVQVGLKSKVRFEMNGE